MHRIVYSCYAQRDIEPDDLRQIADSAARRNSQMGITGALLYSRRRFIHILEGIPDALFDMLTLIGDDVRASSLKLEFIEPVEIRLFDPYPMYIADATGDRALDRHFTRLIHLFTESPGAGRNNPALVEAIASLRETIDKIDTPFALEA